MTKQEQNQIIKDSLVRNLQKTVNIPDDIGEVYRGWVLGLIQNSQSQLQQNQRPVEQQQAQEQPEQQEA